MTILISGIFFLFLTSYYDNYKIVCSTQAVLIKLFLRVNEHKIYCIILRNLNYFLNLKSYDSNYMINGTVYTGVFILNCFSDIVLYEIE